MTRARREQVSLLDTPYYHCISRCVRRSFLCGEDAHSGACFEHRRQWIVERLALLEQVFAIDIAAYAIMSNHYHLVLHVNGDQQQNWSDAEVIERWLKLFRGPPLIHRFLLEGELSSAERDKVAEIVMDWRERLADISWFMRCLNEHIARQANQNVPPILERLLIDPEQWRRTMLPSGLKFPSAVGCAGRLKQYAANIGLPWTKGMSITQQLYCQPG